MGWKCKESWRRPWDPQNEMEILGSHCQKLRTLQWSHSQALCVGVVSKLTHRSLLMGSWRHPTKHPQLRLEPHCRLALRVASRQPREHNIKQRKHIKSENLNQNLDENAGSGQENFRQKLVDITQRKWAALVVGVLHRLICSQSPYLLPPDTF